MAGIKTPEGLVRPEVHLTGTDGNAFAIMGTVRRALVGAENSQDVIDAFMEEAMSGDYDHVLQTAMAYADVT